MPRSPLEYRSGYLLNPEEEKRLRLDVAPTNPHKPSRQKRRFIPLCGAKQTHIHKL